MAAFTAVFVSKVHRSAQYTVNIKVSGNAWLVDAQGGRGGWHAGCTSSRITPTVPQTPSHPRQATQKPVIEPTRS